MFASTRSNHFLWQELRRTSTAEKPNWSFVMLRVIPLSFLTLVALIPVFYYIDDSRVDWLPLMAIVLFIPRPILAIRSIFIGIQSIRQDIIQKRWEQLILTGFPARKIVSGKWAGIVSQTYRDQLLFALPTVGLALGISQYFHSTSYNCGVGQPMLTNPPYVQQSIDLLFKPYCYYGNLAYFGGQLNPSPSVLLIGLMLIITTALMETALNASIGLVVGLSQLAEKGLGIVYGAVIHIGLLSLVFLFIPLMQDNLRYNLNCGNFILIRRDICPTYTWVRKDSLLVDFYRTYDTVQLAVMSLIDQGTLLAANVMRPSDDRWIEQPHFSQSRLTYVRKNHYDNRPFVLRNLIAAAISAFFYWLLIRYFLRRAAHFAIVNHGASGYLEL